MYKTTQTSLLFTSFPVRIRRFLQGFCSLSFLGDITKTTRDNCFKFLLLSGITSFYLHRSLLAKHVGNKLALFSAGDVHLRQIGRVLHRLCGFSPVLRAEQELRRCPGSGPDHGGATFSRSTHGHVGVGRSASNRRLAGRQGQQTLLQVLTETRMTLARRLDHDRLLWGRERRQL